MRRIRNRGAAALLVALAAMMAVVLVPGVASAHEEKEVGPYHLAVGFGDEPAYAGTENSVQMFLDKGGKPVVDLGPTLKVAVSFGSQTMDQMTMEPNFEIGEFGIPGDYRAFFIPTRPGDYSFHLTGTIKGTPVNETFTSGPNTFSSVDDPSSVEFPVKDPTNGELGEAVQRLQPRVDAVVAAQRKQASSLSDEVDSAKSLATVALIVGGALGLIGIALGAAGLASARRARRGTPVAARE